MTRLTIADVIDSFAFIPNALLALFGRNRSATVAAAVWVMLLAPLDVIEDMFVARTSMLPVGIIEAVITDAVVDSYSTNISLTVNGFVWKYSGKVTVPVGTLLPAAAVVRYLIDASLFVNPFTL